MAKGKETKNLPVSVEDQIRKELDAQKGQVGALPSNKIQLRDKAFTLPDGQSTNDPIPVVILDFIWFMVHYPGVYNASNPQQPDCFAIGRDKPTSGLLKPHEDVKKPHGKTCDEGVCPMNEWGSAPSGRGKACKNQRRLLVVPPDFTDETDPMTMFVSPGGLKNFDAYVSRLKNEHGILPVQAVTKVSFDSNQSYPLLKFSFIEKHNNVNLAWALKERHAGMLTRPVEVQESKAA